MPPNLGVKYSCFKCGSKFYDLKKPAPLCPKCGADQRESPPPEQPAAERRRARSKTPADVDATPVAEAETASVEGDGDEDEEEPEAEAAFDEES